MKRDLRSYARQTRVRLVAGALLLIFVVGDLLIYWIYGAQAALMGLVCTGAALLPVLVIVILLQVLGWVAKKSNPDE